MTEATNTPRYWIAINGSGCAMSMLPWKNPTTVPVSEQMFGFPTVEEARQAQLICLNKPIPEVMAYLRSLGPDIKSGRVVYKRPRNPGPQTRGRTAWMEEDSMPPGADATADIVRQAMDDMLGPAPILPGLPGGPPLN
jgi:hypothetical protein